MHMVALALLALVSTAWSQSTICMMQDGKIVCLTTAQFDALLKGAPVRHETVMASDGWGDCIHAKPAPKTISIPEYDKAVALADAIARRRKGSKSIGPAHDGKLKNASAIPHPGYGYRLSRPKGGRNFGTDELVAGLIRASADLRNADPDMPDLTIGDLSDKDGGEISGHVSHENGRDVDLMLYHTDNAGGDIVSSGAYRFNSKGQDSKKKRRFDADRNWRVVKALVNSPYFGPEIDFILIAPGLEKLLIAHADKIGEDETLVRRAKSLLSPPGENVDAHDDHFHLRITAKAQARLAKAQ